MRQWGGYPDPPEGVPDRVTPPGGTWPGNPPGGYPDPPWGVPGTPLGGTWLGTPRGGTQIPPGVPDWVPPRGVPGPPGGGYLDPPGGTWLGTPPGGVPDRVPPPGGVPDRVPPPGGYPGRTTEGVLTTRRAVCLLRSRRRTFLFSFYSHTCMHSNFMAMPDSTDRINSTDFKMEKTSISLKFWCRCTTNTTTLWLSILIFQFIELFWNPNPTTKEQKIRTEI